MQAEPVQNSPVPVGWRAWLDRRVGALLLLGFSAGLPLLLIFSSLSIWLLEAGIARSDVTLFSWAALGYSFKYLWAPLMDQLTLPWLTRRLGRRRGWLLLTQLGVILSIVWMAMTDPAQGTTQMALAAILLGFSSASQDIVIDALRIESAEPRMQALLSSAYIAGYRIGMLAAGAGALKLAAAFAEGSGYDYLAWRHAYLCMGALMLVGVGTLLLIREPESKALAPPRPLSENLRFLLLFLVAACLFVVTFLVTSDPFVSLTEGARASLGAFGGFLVEVLRLGLALSLATGGAWLGVRLGLARAETLRGAYLEPIGDFLGRFGRMAILILLLIGFYRVSDIVLGVISNVFYTELGFDKDQIANIAKTLGLLMTLLGGFVGGALALRFGVMPILLAGAVLSSATNLLFLLLAHSQPTEALLALVIAADNLAGGLASAAFVAYLSALTSIHFTAFQYAVYSSLMTLFPKLLGGYSGGMVDTLGYGNFFILTTLLGLPVILLCWLIWRRQSQGPNPATPTTGLAP